LPYACNACNASSSSCTLADVPTCCAAACICCKQWLHGSIK
jgi:hypothetical protein